jgi:hypothetical protein
MRMPVEHKEEAQAGLAPAWRTREARSTAVTPVVDRRPAKPWFTARERGISQFLRTAHLTLPARFSKSGKSGTIAPVLDTSKIPALRSETSVLADC